MMVWQEKRESLLLYKHHFSFTLKASSSKAQTQSHSISFPAMRGEERREEIYTRFGYN